MARKTKEEAEKTREAILESALDLFIEKGYAGTTLNDVAQCLELTKGAVYWHFKSKQDLFNSLVEEVENRFENVLMPISKKIKEALELKEFFMEYANLSLNDNRIRKFFNIMSFKIEWTKEFEKISKRFYALQKEVHKFCTKMIKKSQKEGKIDPKLKPKIIASILIMMVDGIIFESLNPDSDIDLTLLTVKTSLDIFFKGIAS